MRERKYARNKAVEYAGKWAYSRNPKYYNFDLIGGDELYKRYRMVLYKWK